MSRDLPFVDAPVRAPRAYELLAERIRSGELAEGDRLPPETVLATEARVSRSTVREALRMLEEIQLGDPEAAALMTRKHVNDFRTGWERAGLSADLPIEEVSDEAVERAGRAAVSAL